MAYHHTFWANLSDGFAVALNHRYELEDEEREGRMFGEVEEVRRNDALSL